MSPTSVGLMITWVMRLSPDPSLAGVIFQRTLSPTFKSFTPSPGSSARSQTKSGAHTMVGKVEPNTKTVAPGFAAGRHVAVSSPVPAKGDALLLLGRQPGVRPGKQRHPWRRIEPLLDWFGWWSRLPIGETGSEKRVCREQDCRQEQGAR